MHTTDKARVLISVASVSSVPAESWVCLGCSFRIQRCKTLLTYTPMVSFLFPGINTMHLFSMHIQFWKRTCISLYSYTHLLTVCFSSSCLCNTLLISSEMNPQCFPNLPRKATPQHAILSILLLQHFPCNITIVFVHDWVGYSVTHSLDNHLLSRYFAPITQPNTKD